MTLGLSHWVSPKITPSHENQQTGVFCFCISTWIEDAFPPKWSGIRCVCVYTIQSINLYIDICMYILYGSTLHSPDPHIFFGVASIQVSLETDWDKLWSQIKSVYNWHLYSEIAREYVLIRVMFWCNYHLVSQHNYGTSPFFMGQSTINHHFP